MKIHSEASNIFSRTDLGDVIEIRRRIASSTKKFATSSRTSENNDGKNSKRTRKNRIPKPLSRLSPFFFRIKFSMKNEPKTTVNATEIRTKSVDSESLGMLMW